FKNFRDKELPLPLINQEDRLFYDDKDILYLKSLDSMYNQEKVTESVSVGTTWCKLYKKELIFDNHLKFNPILTRAQDTVFTMNAFSHANKISYYNTNLYHYRISNTSTSSGSRYIKDTLMPFNELLKEMYSFSN